MENFILYEEIGRGNNSIVYKGRRKGTVKFLAILCIEKDERAAITNWVRLIHEIDHGNIVKFYEWYETSNHLWMVIELCTGGTLQEVLTQDGCLPEETVCQFGKDILCGLNYLHKHGVVFADLSPKKVLLDGPGKLKLTNFCISRLYDENLEEVYTQASAEDGTDIKCFNLKGSTEYQAPELLNGAQPTLASDIWAFGALLYHLYTGNVPFQSGASSDSKSDDYNIKGIKRRSGANKQMPQAMKDEEVSDEFTNLLNSIFEKQPEKRPTAAELLNHPFWKDLVQNEESLNQTNKSQMYAGGDKTGHSPLMKSLTLKRDEAGDRSSRHSLAPESVNVLDSTFTLSSRPHTASGVRTSKHNQSAMSDTYRISYGKNESISNSVSKRPPSSGSITQIPNKSSVKEEDKEPATAPSQSVKDLIYHDSDFELAVIQDNPQVRKVEALKWDVKALPFQVLPSVDRVTPDEMYNHLKQILQALNQPSSTNYLRSKSNVMSYLGHLCVCSCAVANFTINSQLLPMLAALIKTCIQQSPDIACKAARVIGLAASCATELEHCTRISDVFSTLTDGLRENFRNIRAKVAVIPALGQLLYLVAEQEEESSPPDDQRPPSQQRGNWSIPSTTYSLITRCLREGEDPTVQHYACKTIEAVTTTAGIHGKRFLTATAQGSSNNPSSHSDVIGPLLWTVSVRATNENLKHAALSAVCRLNKLSGAGSVLQVILDRVGLPAVLSILARASFKCQQALVTSLIETLHSAPKGHAARLANGKDLLPSLMRLFDSPSSKVRTKVILVVFLLLKRNPSLLVTACQLRLIMYIEREGRRLTPMSAGQRSSTPATTDYTNACLNLLIQHVATQAPSIAASSITILDETVVRKHPSSNQVKQLRQNLPTCLILQHLVTSQIFRTLIVTSEFVCQLGLLLSHATVFLRKTSQSSAMASAVGDDIIQKFVDAVISIVECLSQHPLVLTQHAEASMTSLVPNLITLLGAYGGGDGQIVCIKLLTDVLGTLLHYRAMTLDYPLNPLPVTPMKTPPSRQSSASSARNTRFRRQDVPDDYGTQEIITLNLIPEFQPLLTGRDPLPAYAARFLGSLLEHWPSLSTSLYNYGLIPVLMNLFEKQQSLRSYAQGVTTVLTYMIQYDDELIANQLYDNGIVDHLSAYLTKISSHYSEMQYPTEESQIIDAASVIEGLVQLLTLMKCMLDRVTHFVKQALQTHHSVSASSSSIKTSSKTRTENAEQLLVHHKPLTEWQSLCVQLLCGELELSELALACLSMLVQLYGGDHPDTMSHDNMTCLAHALTQASPKTQRILLKLIRRVITLNKCHADQIASPDGSTLGKTIRLVLGNAEKRADSSVASLSADILEIAGNSAK